MTETICLKVQRNGRIWINQATGKKEELLDVFWNDKKILRGVCYKYFTMISGTKFKKKEVKFFDLSIIDEK